MVTTAGIVLAIVILGVVIGIVVIKHIRTNRDGVKVDSLDEAVYTASASSRRSSFTTSEDEVELTEADFEDELVEDQYLPSDSELKSGLELMFLKQQRHYWTRKKKPWPFNSQATSRRHQTNFRASVKNLIGYVVQIEPVKFFVLFSLDSDGPDWIFTLPKYFHNFPW